MKKRGRPKENKGYFHSFHKQVKKARVEPISSVAKELLDEENAIRQEEDNFYAADDRIASIADVNHPSSPPISPANDSSMICVKPAGVIIHNNPI